MEKLITVPEKRHQAKIGSLGGRRSAESLSKRQRVMRARKAGLARHHKLDFAAAKSAVEEMRSAIEKRAAELVRSNPRKTAREIAITLQRENKFTLSFAGALAVVRVAALNTSN